MSACRECDSRNWDMTHKQSLMHAAIRKAARTEAPRHITAIAAAKAQFAESQRWLEAHRADCEVSA